MRPRRLALVIALVIGGAVTSLDGGASAQPSPEVRATAIALFDDARTLMAAGKFTEACPKLEQSQKMDPGIGTLYNLSDCYEKIGRTASAWIGFRDVAGQALAAGQSDREQAARARVAALEPKLMRLKVVVSAAASSISGLTVTRDGAVMSPGVFGTAIPLDPGKHAVGATASGKEAWERAVTLQEAGAVVTVEVPPLLDKKPGAKDAKDEEGAAPHKEPPRPPRPSPRPWQRPVGIAATAIGAVGLGVGTVFGVLGKAAFDDSNKAHCNATTNKCDDTGIALRDGAVTKGNIGTGVFIAGAALAVGGVALWITAPSGEKRESARIGVGPGGVTISGGF